MRWTMSPRPLRRIINIPGKTSFSCSYFERGKYNRPARQCRPVFAGVNAELEKNGGAPYTADNFRLRSDEKCQSRKNCSTYWPARPVMAKSYIMKRKTG
jgi:hypothetical protein